MLTRQGECVLYTAEELTYWEGRQIISKETNTQIQVVLSAVKNNTEYRDKERQVAEGEGDRSSGQSR